jgi:hypothetical protein
MLSLLILVFPLSVFAQDHKSDNSTNEGTEEKVEVATFNVTNGFEQEVSLETMTRLEWTLIKGDGTYDLSLELPGKQIPASGWKAIYEDLGWDIAKVNELKLEFSDGTSATLYIDVIGNSGKVRFWMVSESKTEPQQEEEKVNANSTFKIIIPKKDGKTLSKNVDLTFEWINKEATLNGTWYIWINTNDQPFMTKNMNFTLENLAPGTHQVKVVLRGQDGKVLSETKEVFIVPTDDGGTLPKTATPWPTLLVVGAILMGLGVLARGIIHALPIK